MHIGRLGHIQGGVGQHHDKIKIAVVNKIVFDRNEDGFTHFRIIKRQGAAHGHVIRSSHGGYVTIIQIGVGVVIKVVEIIRRLRRGNQIGIIRDRSGGIVDLHTTRGTAHPGYLDQGAGNVKSVINVYGGFVSRRSIYSSRVTCGFILRYFMQQKILAIGVG